MLRAAARVLLRTIVKANVYLAIAIGALWVFERLGSRPAWLTASAGAGSVVLALWVFRDKVLEEAQRIGGRS